MPKLAYVFFTRMYMGCDCNAARGNGDENGCGGVRGEHGEVHGGGESGGAHGGGADTRHGPVRPTDGVGAARDHGIDGFLASPHRQTRDRGARAGCAGPPQAVPRGAPRRAQRLHPRLKVKQQAEPHLQRRRGRAGEFLGGGPDGGVCAPSRGGPHLQQARDLVPFRAHCGPPAVGRVLRAGVGRSQLSAPDGVGGALKGVGAQLG
mmetsp:Transcript_54266/g.107742  ORF Transcript_54266/g.107742 Transcript_54266/m.107742 type:complete len:206 (+) Transcript_54266:37-654(+)